MPASPSDKFHLTIFRRLFHSAADTSANTVLTNYLEQISSWGIPRWFYSDNCQQRSWLLANCVFAILKWKKKCCSTRPLIFGHRLQNRSCDDKKLQQIIRNNPNSLLVLPVVFPEKKLRRSTAPAIMREASPQRKWTSKEGMMEADSQTRNSVVVLEAGWGSDVTRLPPTVGRVLVQSHHRELDCQGWLWTSQKHPESCDREISIAVDGKVALFRLIFLGFLFFWSCGLHWWQCQSSSKFLHSFTAIMLAVIVFRAIVTSLHWNNKIGRVVFSLCPYPSASFASLSCLGCKKISV